MTDAVTGTGPDKFVCPPVALIVFNRPDYTSRVLEAVRAASPRHLLIIADGPRPGRIDDQESCGTVRKLIDRMVDWECEVTRFYSGTNMGCAARVSSGLELVFNEVGEAIILEDDCVPIPSFFPFCADLLKHYRGNPTVGMIAGTNYRGVNPVAGDSYCFSAHFSIWGWATWRRAFAGFDPKMTAWRSTVHPADIARNWSDSRSRRLHTAMFDVFRERVVDSWDIAWNFHLSNRHLLSVVPSVNLVSNIGVHGTRGRAGDANNMIPTGFLDLPLRHPDGIAADQSYDRLVAGRHRLYRDWMRSLWISRVRRILGMKR